MGVRLMRRQHSSAASIPIPPKGCMAVRVVGRPVGGGGGAEEQEEEEEERFVVPVAYLKHPLFLGLLKEAEEEYGFRQQGVITIPCGVDNFRRVQGIIDHRHKHHHAGTSSSVLAACFRA